MLRHPLQAVRMRIPHRWSRRTVILLVMQTVDAAMHLRPKRKLLRRAASGCRPSRTPSGPTRSTSRPPRRRPAGSPSAPAASPRARSPSRSRTSPPPPTSSAAPCRRRPRERRRRRRQPRLRLREPAGHRRGGDPGQPRRQPEPDDHRQGRARDELDPAQGRGGAAPPAGPARPRGRRPPSSARPTRQSRAD